MGNLAKNPISEYLHKPKPDHQPNLLEQFEAALVLEDLNALHRIKSEIDQILATPVNV